VLVLIARENDPKEAEAGEFPSTQNSALPKAQFHQASAGRMLFGSPAIIGTDRRLGVHSIVWG
jgi:hypothetical protein